MKGTVEVGLKVNFKKILFILQSVRRDRERFVIFITVGIITNEFRSKFDSFLLLYFFILRRLSCSSAFRVMAPTALSRGPGNRKA